jgi:methionyl-tRNA synthetase
MFDQYLCTNTKCKYMKSGKKGKNCPECGKKLSKVGIREGTSIIQKKKKFFS